MGAGDGAELDARLALMDRAGVDMQILSASPQLDDLGMAGVAMTTTILGQPLVDSPAAQLFAELDRRSTVLYLHSARNAACTPLIANHNGTWSVGAPVEDTISLLHLITHGVPSRYLRMKIHNSHLGGALPMLLQRTDNQIPWEAPETPERPSMAAGRMWYDTVGHGHPPALRCAADSPGADRLVLGTDFPYENGAVFDRAITYITTSGLTPGDADCILSTNTQALLGLVT